MYATIINQPRIIHQTTESIRAAILARDAMERESDTQQDFETATVFDAKKAENDATEAAGYARPMGDWRVRYMYQDRTMVIWSNAGSNKMQSKTTYFDHN